MNYKLFKEINPFASQVLAKMPEIIHSLIPMNKAQKHDLPYACKDLSEELTSDRQALTIPYWTKARFLAAYFHYFLPWNCIRLVKLFPTLNLGKIPENPLIVDLGSGPLTLPLALWLARPDLRKEAVSIVCCDIAPQPLNLGKKLFETLIKEFDPNSQWKIHTLKTPLHKALGQIKGKPWLITMGNVLNEGEEKKNYPIHVQIEHLLREAQRILREDGKIFAVEPGTRQGARVLSILRHKASQKIIDYEDDDFDDDFNDDVDNDFLEEVSDEQAPFVVLSPCTHNDICPLSNQKNGIKHNSAWCHFNCQVEKIPHGLKKLSEQSGLDKKSISLSYIYLAKREEGLSISKKYKNQKNMARIISDAFIIPNFDGRARYACHNQGLMLLPGTQKLSSGDLCEIIVPKPIKRDMKSKAIIAFLKDN